ncbi:hypothetical protein KI387_039934, partial [Taxus chinensis]
TSFCYGIREGNQKVAMEILIHYGLVHSRFMNIVARMFFYSRIWTERHWNCLVE